MDLKFDQCIPGEHRGSKVIWVKFPKNRKLIDDFRARFRFAKWSASKSCWYLPDAQQIREQLGLAAPVPGMTLLMQIPPVNRPAFTEFLDHLKLKAYSRHTLRTYSTEFAQLLYFLKSYPVKQLDDAKLKAYFLHCLCELGVSEAQLNSRINAIKFYFEHVLKRSKVVIDLPRPKKPSLLPKVLSKEEIKRIFDVVMNTKHKLMLKLCYGMGLRVSEVVNLKIEHIDSKRMQVLVAGAKGKKDRYVHLPGSVLKDLREYYKAARPKDFLFEGQYGGQYSVRSVQAVFKAALKKARVRKKVGIHGLRHSYATHLLEAGTDIAFIQKLLGHNSIKTTEIYTHVGTSQVAGIKSPLDTL
jgi:integrase/recombinase XerD